MLCCAIDSARIQIYRADNYYKLTNSIKGQNGLIRDLKIINQNQILICDDQSSIFVIDYTKKCQILKKTHHYEKFLKKYVEFDSQNQVIIFHQGSSINFYKMNGETAIFFYDTIIYDRIQIIKNTNHLLGRHTQSLVIWLMDYKQRNQIKLREFQNENQIYGTQFLAQSQLIILDYKFIIILDLNDFKITYRQRHYLQYDDVRSHSKLTVTSNHLFILCVSSLEILKIIMM